MIALFTCKYEEDPIKNEPTRVLTEIKNRFFRSSRAGNSASSWSNRAEVRARLSFLWLSFLPTRMIKIQSKMKEIEVLTTFLQL